MADSVIGAQNVWPYYSKENVDKAGTSTTKSGMLGKDDFLKILMAQMSNQDPTQPLQDRDFIAQMAQFTSVEQLTNMATEMKTMRQSLGFSSGMIGKQITWKAIDDTGAEIVKDGIVDSITFKDGMQYAGVGEEQISLEHVLKITNPGGN